MDKNIAAQNKTIRITNIFATLLVMVVHYKSINYLSQDNVNNNYYIQEFLYNGIARIAVPFFAMASGYFYFSSSKKYSYKTLIQRKVRTLFIPYIISSYFIYLSVFLINISNGIHEFDAYRFIKTIVTLLLHPSVHLWYIRDLLGLSIICYAVIKLKRNTKLIITLISGFLWLFEIQPFPLIWGWYLLSIETVFFFLMGILIADYDQFERFIINNKRLLILTSIWIFVVVLRIRIDPDFFIWYTRNFTYPSLLIYKLGIILGIPILINLGDRLKTSAVLKKLSQYTFFVYLYHMDPFGYFKRLTSHIVNPEYAFYSDYPIAVVGIFSIAILMAKILPKTYALFTGDRNSNTFRKKSKAL